MLTRSKHLSLLLMFGLCLAPGVAGAQESLTLSLGTGTIQFADAAPSSGTLAAVQNPVAVSVGYSGTGNWVLTVLAGGDLLSADATIPISSVNWTATGAAFVPGTLSKSSAQTVGSGTTSANGSLRFFLKNSWLYATGNYAQGITFTVTSF